MVFEYVTTFTLIMEHWWLMEKSQWDMWIDLKLNKKGNFALCLWHKPIFLNFSITIKSIQNFDPKKVFYTKQHMFCWILWHVTSYGTIFLTFQRIVNEFWLEKCTLFIQLPLNPHIPLTFFPSTTNVKEVTYSKNIHGHFGSVRRQKTRKN